MMIYNTVDYPIAISIEGTVYHMERDSELEFRLPGGTYSYRMYMTKRYGDTEPLGRKLNADVCYAESGQLIANRDTKVYIRETQEILFRAENFFRDRGRKSYRVYRASLFDVTAVDGELADRRRGCQNQDVYNRTITPVKIKMWMFLSAHLLFLILAVLFGFCVFGGIHPMISYVIAGGCVLMQAVLIDKDIQQVHLLKNLRTIPILREGAEYDQN